MDTTVKDKILEIFKNNIKGEPPSSNAEIVNLGISSVVFTQILVEIEDLYELEIDLEAMLGFVKIEDVVHYVIQEKSDS